jgi:hypothetical protein
MSTNCILCGALLKTPCEETYGVCKDDSVKVKTILSMAMSIGGFGKHE